MHVTCYEIANARKAHDILPLVRSFYTTFKQSFTTNAKLITGGG